MNVRISTLAELNRRATSVLAREIGPVETIRFLNQFRTGHGDYTVEREELFKDVSAGEIIEQIKVKRRAGD